MAVTGLIIGAVALFIFWIPVLGWALMAAGMGLSIIGFVANREREERTGTAIAGIAVNAVPLTIHVVVYGISYLVWQIFTQLFSQFFVICRFIPFC